uniref:NADH dehydrogenase [ubiquinone] 1 beta subcomplex subunit 11, mitochondrial n=1 Tax=Graphocephala atropunctata TaxID=36148 RepID=A0A1B6LK36_9HEMI
MSSLSRIFKFSALRRISSVPQCVSTVRTISTSNKKNDTTTAVEPTAVQAEDKKTVGPPKKKYFYEYGFSGKTEEEEHNNMHAMFFTYITMGAVFLGFFIYYKPNHNMHDWALREGYLELRRREQLGLPLIDPNYVDPSTVFLPSDEDLGDTEIII